MSNKLHNQSVDNLFDAILTLRNREECYAFFMDVCTMNEIASLSQRRDDQPGQPLAELRQRRLSDGLAPS